MADSQDILRDALRAAASALSAADLDYALAGGYALYAHGANEPTHDVDVVVAEEQTERAADVLAAAGFEIERPPENWLFKAWLDGALVDVLHRQTDVPVDRRTLAQAGPMQLFGVWVPVLPPTVVVIAKLASLSEHYCDFGALLSPVRAVREQLDWDAIERATKDNDYAVAFLYLARRLGIAPDDIG